MKINDQYVSAYVSAAIREVFRDRLVCVNAGYKRTNFRLVTKIMVAEAIKRDSKVSANLFARKAGVAPCVVYGWIKDYEQSNLSLLNACAIRRT